MSAPLRRYAATSDEVEHLDSELSESLAKIRADIEKLDWDTKQAGAPLHAKKEEILRIKTEIDKARAVLQNFKVELRELDRDDLAVYQPKTRQYQSGLDELTRNLNFIKSSVEKEELVSNGSAKSDPAQNKSAAELIALAQKTQEEDKEGILRMQRMVQQSEDVGIATNVKLKMQTEQLKNIGVDVANVNARMKDANKLLNQIGRRMETDKFLMFFIVAMILGIMGVVVAKAFGWDKPSAQAGVVNVGGAYLVVDCAVMVNHPACKKAAPADKCRSLKDKGKCKADQTCEWDGKACDLSVAEACKTLEEKEKCVAFLACAWDMSKETHCIPRPRPKRRLLQVRRRQETFQFDATNHDHSVA